MKHDDINPGQIPEGVTVIKFSTPNCGPCKVLTPQFEGLSNNKVTFLSVNPQENMDWILEKQIRSVPVTLGFVDGEEKFRVQGVNIESIKSEISKIVC